MLTRARYCAKWGVRSRFDARVANEKFDGFNPKRAPGASGEDHIDPAVIQTDLDQVDADAAVLREYAERAMAHRTPKAAMHTSGITLQALHKAISDVWRVVEKYYSLLTLVSPGLQWEPTVLFDMIAPFMTPWVVDREAVEEAAKEEGEE